MKNSRIPAEPSERFPGGISGKILEENFRNFQRIIWRYFWRSSLRKTPKETFGIIYGSTSKRNLGLTSIKNNNRTCARTSWGTYGRPPEKTTWRFPGGTSRRLSGGTSARTSGRTPRGISIRNQGRIYGRSPGRTSEGIPRRTSGSILQLPWKFCTNSGNKFRKNLT